MEMEEGKIKELNAAYLCVKATVADDLSCCEEFKRVLQYAGHNPTHTFLAEKWKLGETETMSYETFCNIAEKLPEVVIDDIETLFMKVFGTVDGKVKENEFRNLLMTNQEAGELSEADLDYILDEADVIKDGVIDCSKLGKVIMHTINEMKQMSLQKLEERSNFQRVNSKTYTKKKVDKMPSPEKTVHTAQVHSAFDIDGWQESSLKGCFYLDKQNIMAHQYSLEVSTTGPIMVKVATKVTPKNKQGEATDALAYIFRESPEGMRNYVGYTDKRDYDGSYYWHDTLKEGRYVVIPFTSGCRLHERGREPDSSIDLVENKGKVLLTPECRKVLEEIFYQVDLDGNGHLNRQEFNLYNWRTSGEEVQDDEWAVVQSNFDVKENELTLNGFLALHQLEAEDNGGDSEDLWVSLEAMGYNRMGQQDQAAPFQLSVHSQVCQPSLVVSGLKSGGLLLDKAVIRSIMENAEPVKIKNMIDLIKYEFIGKDRGSIVIQNKAHSKVRVRVDCSQSTNVATNRPNLDWTVEVAGKSAIIAHQLMPQKLGLEWNVVCEVVCKNDLAEREEE